VTRNCPSGRKASAQGFASPEATGTSETVGPLFWAPLLATQPKAIKNIAALTLLMRAKAGFFMKFTAEKSLCARMDAKGWQPQGPRAEK
jgi:hypothetical protein